jgi:hypothetical protein
MMRGRQVGRDAHSSDSASFRVTSACGVTLFGKVQQTSGLTLRYLPVLQRRALVAVAPDDPWVGVINT